MQNKNKSTRINEINKRKKRPKISRLTKGWNSEVGQYKDETVNYTKDSRRGDKNKQRPYREVEALDKIMTVYEPRYHHSLPFMRRNGA